MKNKLIKIGVIAIICLLVANFGFLIIINKKTNCDYPLILEVHTVYQEGHFQERAKILQYNTNNDSGLIFAVTMELVYVKFYNLDINETYIIDKGCCFSHEFTNSTEVTICMIVIEKNFSVLAKNQTGIIGIFIGEYNETHD